MNDSDIIKWLQYHITTFVEHDIRDGKEVYKMTYLDNQGIERKVLGNSLRECVKNAVDGQYIPDWEV